MFVGINETGALEHTLYYDRQSLRCYC